MWCQVFGNGWAVVVVIVCACVCVCVCVCVCMKGVNKIEQVRKRRRGVQILPHCLHSLYPVELCDQFVFFSHFT